MIAAVVVTYNRKEMLCKNLDMLLFQMCKIDKICIIDNHSSDGTQSLIRKKYEEYLDVIDYYYLEENIGGAGGFEYGCRVAYEKGYDYVWLMDDDGRPMNENTLFSLIEVVKNLDTDEFILNSLVIQDTEKLSFGLDTHDEKIDAVKARANDRGIYIGKINPFNGTLVSKDVFKKIGFPNGQFFIKGDEHDFMMRALHANVYIATVVDSEYYHPGEKNVIKRIMGKTIFINIETAWKEYYKMRNYTYMRKRDSGSVCCFKELLKYLFILIISSKAGFENFNMVVRGFVDGYKGKLGNSVKP